MTHLCNETLVTVVNGQLPGPAIEVTEGDSVTVHVVNKSPHNITIHWYFDLSTYLTYFNFYQVPGDGENKMVSSTLKS
jgi:FtsP/CotA-like multicopper oxidase with cupredoxin domain